MLSYRKMLIAAGSAIFAGQVAVAQGLEVEVIHDWVSGGESRALNTIADRFEAQGGTWIDSAIVTEAIAATITRIVGGYPPGAAKFNTGTDMHELADAGLLANINTVADEQNWSERLPSFVWEAIQRDGNVYAAPLNLQSEVWLWYSTKVFEEAGAELPTTYDELFTALDKIRDAGFIPLAVGGQPWQERILFYKVLAGVSPKTYLKFNSNDWKGALASPEFIEAAEIFGRLRGYVDDGSPGRYWNSTTNLIITNQAGMQVMGDWAKGEFFAAGLTAGQEFGCLQGPGSHAIVLSGDVFVFPKNDDQREGQLLLASVMLDQNTQVEFNINKGSMPVILDADVSGMDICTQAAMETLADPANRLPASPFMLSSDTREGIDVEISVYWNDRDATVEGFVYGLTSVFNSTM